MALAVVGALVFGGIAALTVFIRQLLLSRDRKLNDEAQRKALADESHELEKIRVEMESRKRFNAHYEMLGVNKEAIQYIDQKLEDTLSKKAALVQRYSEMMLREAKAFIGTDDLIERKSMCLLIKEEMDRDIKFYDSELLALQARRAAMWDAQQDLQDTLIYHEQTHNSNLDKLYESHTSMLEKVYMRQSESADKYAKQNLDAGSDSYKEIFMGPIEALVRCFKPANNASSDKIAEETVRRKKVRAMERNLNRARASDPETFDDFDTVGAQGMAP